MSDSPSCPVCEEPIESHEDNESFPFCSKRCKDVDLGRWFDEQYTIPITPRQTERRLQADDEQSDTSEP